MHRKDILETGISLTTGDRNKTYGSPYKNHEDIAKGWEVILGIPIRPDQVASCMAWLKIARTIKKPDYMDNYVDGATYMAIAGELAAEWVDTQRAGEWAAAAKEDNRFIDSFVETSGWPDSTEGDGAVIASPAVTFGR